MKLFRHITFMRGRGLAALALLLALALVVAIAACESDDDPTAAPTTAAPASANTPASSPDVSGDSMMDGEKLSVVATSNIVADWVRQVGGDRVDVKSLLPVGGDPHTYQPGARDVAEIVDADLVLTVGLGLEGQWLEDLIHNASADESRVIALAEAVDPIEFSETGAHDDHDEDMDGEEHGALNGRVIIADGASPTLSVLDLATGTISEMSLNVAAPAASLYTSPSGRFAFALSRGPEENDDRVHIFDGGIYLLEHGDHFDLITEPVSRLTLETTDERPVHVSVHNGWTTIFHDGSGRLALFEEHDLEDERNDYEPIWIEAGLQHGAGIVLDDGNVLVTSNNPAFPGEGVSSLPLGAEVRTLQGEVVFDAPNRNCPGMHGEAANSHGVLLGCVGGVLFVQAHFGEYEHTFIENPASMNAAARIGTLWGHDDVENFFGSASYTQEGTRLNGGLWMIDAEGGEMTLVLPATAEKRVLSAAFDGHGEELFALTYDGVLNVINPETGEIEEEHAIVEAFDGDTSPSFTIVGETLYLSDRAHGRIIEFHLGEGEIEQQWPISGQPRSLAFVGIGVGEDENDDHDEDHENGDEDDHDDDEDHEDEDEHEDEHGHDHGSLDPHFWFDPNRVQVAVNDIAERLSAADPGGTSTYRANAAAYNAQLNELHTWTEQQVSGISNDHRILVTSHDSFSYFAVVYGFEVVGTVIPSGTTETESSAEQLAELVEIIEHEGVPAVFGETTVTERIARTVADETGADFYSLYSGSLGEAGSGADTYIGMVRANVERIVEALS